MTIAFTVDHFKRLGGDFFREGISVFFSYLISAMANSSGSLRFEVWTYSFNRDIITEYFFKNVGLDPRNVKIFSGLSFSFDNLVKAVRIFKHAFSYYVLSRQKSLPRLQMIINHSYIRPASPAMILKERKKLERKVKKHSKADVVFPFFPALSLGQVFNCKKVMQIHDLFTLPYRDLFMQIYPDIDERNKDLIDVLTQYSKSNTVFVSSTNYIRDTHILHYIPGITIEQTKVIPYPPMVKELNSLALLSRDDFLKKYNLSDGYIAFPSQIRPNKNVIVILRALHALKQKGIILNFVITGTLSHFPPVLEFAGKNNLLGQIFEIGDLPEEDLSALYKYSSLVICPSIIEGPGISQQCLDALSAGNVPVIHARSFGIKESLESVGLDFETADLNWFDVDDYNALVSHIEDVLDNPAAHIEKQKHILSFYTKNTWSDTAGKYLSLINDAQ